MIKMRCKRGLVLGIFIILFLILMSIFFVSSASEKSNKISQEVYEKLEKRNEVNIIVKMKLEKKDNKDLIALKVSKEELERLKKNPNIEKVVYSPQIKAFLQDSVPLINATNVWPIQLSGKNITGIDETICIIDTGINFSHPDLIGKNKTCVIDCYNKDCVENCSIFDDNGHGTHVAGIAAASGGIKGVGINISLIGLKMLDSNGSGHPQNGTLNLMDAINWCISNRNTYNISVISMSLGTDTLYNSWCDSDFEDTLTKSIDNATFYNISVIAATGNDGNMTHIASPACIQNTTSVGATTKADVIASYSNRNNITDLFAPGGTANNQIEGINSTSKNGGYVGYYGTSMSTPHAAGAFALVRQFFRLQNNRVPTPEEIKNVLNNTGKRINDSGTGYNFSRIDVYSAIISLDASAPFINLTFPSNNTIQFTQNVTFRCSANDVLLSNITLYIWNSSGIYNNTEVKQLSGVNANAEFNLTNITYENYAWNCLAYDSKGNFSFASSNYTLTIGRILTTLISPSNNLFTNQNQTYNCSAETETTKSLTNITLYIWNSTNNLIYNLTKNISGTSNSTTFSYNFSLEGNYNWNCLAYNNASENAFADSNYTITYDVAFPNITLISPIDSDSYTSNFQQITFSYNVSDNFNISNCSLIINNIINLTNSSITNLSQTQAFSQTFSPETYNWYINCTDSANNQANSSQRRFTVSAPASPVIQQSGGGGGTPVKPVVYEPTIEEVSSPTGYTQTLSKNDKIKFTFFDEKAENHTLIITEIGKDFVNLTIQSSLIKLILGISQSAKLNLTSADYYDLYVKLNSIESNKASLTIQTIHEEIPKPKITGEVVEEKKPEIEEKEIEPESRIGEKIKNVLIIILIVSVLVLLVERMRKEKRRLRRKQIL